MLTHTEIINVIKEYFCTYSEDATVYLQESRNVIILTPVLPLCRMVRRNRKKILKLVLTICAAVFFGGILLKAAVTSLELSTSVMVAIEHERVDAFMTRLPGMSVFHHTKVSLLFISLRAILLPMFSLHNKRVY